jgi:hypothetical protein
MPEKGFITRAATESSEVMEPAFERVAFEGANAYGLRWRERLIAYLWWEQDPLRRDALGWYLRDLRVPARVRRLDLDPAITELARDRRRSPRAWLEDAERLRALTLAAALRRAERVVGEARSLPAVQPTSEAATGYDVYVRGLPLETLALGFPDAPVSSEDDTFVVHVRATQDQLSQAIALIAALGGRVVALLRRDA